MRCASIAVMLTVLCALPAAAGAAVFNPVGTFGSGDLSFPGTSASFDSAGNFYVTDFGSNTLKVFDSSQTLVHTFGAGVLTSPASVVAAPNGTIYVGDVSRIVPMSGSGTVGTPFGTLNSPNGIAADAVSNIYVADTGNNRVVSFSSSGVPQLTLTTAGGVNFHNPLGVAVDANHIYVADSFNDRIAIFDTLGNYQSLFSTIIPAWTDHPKELVVAPDGTIFMSLGDPGFAAFSPTGDLLDTFGGMDRAGGVALFGNTLYGVESGKHLVHVFLVPEPAGVCMLGALGGLLAAIGRPRRSRMH